MLTKTNITFYLDVPERKVNFQYKDTKGDHSISGGITAIFNSSLTSNYFIFILGYC
jgi:hypothetical protein